MSGIAETSAENQRYVFVETSNGPPLKAAVRKYTWDDVKEIVTNNELEDFSRSRETNESYRAFKSKMAEQNTTVFKHILWDQLHWYKAEDNGGLLWQEINERHIPDNQIVVRSLGKCLFECEDDVKILPNHFPYHFEDDISHICVWSKTVIPADPSSPIGDISESTRSVVEKYIQKTFVEGLGVPPENILWFKNWEALQSVKALSHIHVILNKVPKPKVESLFYTPGKILS